MVEVDSLKQLASFKPLGLPAGITEFGVAEGPQLSWAAMLLVLEQTPDFQDLFGLKVIPFTFLSFTILECLIPIPIK